MSLDTSALMEKAGEYLPGPRLNLVKSAFEFAVAAHSGQKRKSGEPYMEHPLATAMILADIQLDDVTLAAALLHDVIEDCGVPLSEIEEKFGLEVRRLVEGVSKLSKITWRGGEGGVAVKRSSLRGSQAENLRRMLIAMAEDLRVVFIKLADRLHNMRTLEALPPDKQKTIARETREIYAPLAHRLGIWQVKWQLEDLSLRYLEPEEYHRIARLIATRRAERENFINDTVRVLQAELVKAGISAEVTGRPKHIFSVYQKMKKYSAMGKGFGDIHDLFAFRVIVNDVPDAYRSLGAVHGLWRPITESFDDFIANPKENGYQSLHTAVLGPGMVPLEVQIRTWEMHRLAQHGVAAHWRYKEGAANDLHFEEKLTWLRQLVEWQGELSSEEFIESIKTDIFIDQVFVYTPRGEIIDLPKGATPLDFAYRIHTELGHRCVGAKVNGRLVPLNYELKNGEIIEIVISKKTKGPSLDWLNPDLGYVRTSHTREKIRQWFKKQERTQNVERGKVLLEKELKRLGTNMPEPENLARSLGFDELEDFYASIGFGGISPRQVILKLMEQSEEFKPQLETKIKKGATPTGIQVLGVGDLLTRIGRCCNPLPGDDIVGYITRTRGVTIHRRDCRTINLGLEPERVVAVAWGKAQDVYPVAVQVIAWDRVGLLRDITSVVAEEKVNISSVTLTEKGDGSVLTLLTIEIRNMAELSRVLARIGMVRSVTNVERKRDAVINSDGRT